jgi:transcriptional regulator with XRE-family HTH domain
MKSKERSLSSATVVSPLPNFIASNLRLLRRDAGWSQSELAERVGLNRGNIASYESGCAEPSICKLLRLSQVFRITTRDFTRRDLRQPAELALARSAHTMEQDGRKERLKAFQRRHDELQGLIESSHQLFEYKRKSMEQPCKEAELLAAHYLQLHELSKQLLQEYDNLLGELGCTCA